jgi:hypothetical protein
MLDAVIVNFHKRRKAGEVFFNPMSSDKVTIATSGSNYEIISRANSCSSPAMKAEQQTLGPLGVYCVPNVVNAGIRMPVESYCLNETELARLKVQMSTEVLSKRGRSDSDLWESLAEYRQALDLLKNPLVKLRNISDVLLKAASRGNTSRALLKEVSGGYLLHRYGVLPAMKDVENVIASLTKLTGRQRKTTRSSGRLYATTQNVFVSSFDTNSVNVVQNVIDSVTVRAMSLDEVDVSFGNNLGFSTKSLVTLPWELLGYSFVYDWLSNVGDFLGAMAPSPGYKQLGSCLVVSRVTANSWSYSSAGMSSPTWTLASPFNGTIGVVRESKTRSELTMPGVVIKSDFKFDSFTRTADAFSLLASRFLKINTLVGPQPNLSAFRQRSAYNKWANQPGVD